MNKAVILFTRVPALGKSKTRLEKLFSKPDCAKLQTAMIADIYAVLKNLDLDIIISYSNDGDLDILQKIISPKHKFIKQEGTSLGEKMRNAFKNCFLNYEKLVLIGSDIPLLEKKDIDLAFDILENNDVAIAPTFDGGFYLLGLKALCPNIFAIEYSTDKVYQETIDMLKSEKLSYGEGNRLLDLDDGNDFFELIDKLEEKDISFAKNIRAFIQDINKRMSIKRRRFNHAIMSVDEFVKDFAVASDETFELFANGEYNVNYLFYSNVHKKNMILRFAVASQMGLEKQTFYEYLSLKTLENTNRTPKVYAFYPSKSSEISDFLVMEYLPGRPLDYTQDLEKAAEILAGIHSFNIPQNEHFVEPKDPVSAIILESTSLFEVYLKSEYRDDEIVKIFEKFFLKAREIQFKYPYKKCIINTELNSGNFLINDAPIASYLVDWEKPIFAYPPQDLGHFLAPTTTYWKTDYILNEEEIDAFLDKYIYYSNEIINREVLKTATYQFISLNCLRGIAWCLMAYTEYMNPGRALKNSDTFEKIKEYLNVEFIESVYKNYVSKL